MIDIMCGPSVRGKNKIRRNIITTDPSLLVSLVIGYNLNIER